MAYKHLVDDYSSSLMGVCLRYMKEDFAAKDALQETYIRIFKSIGNLKDEGNFEGWMRKIAVNECLKILKKNKAISSIDLDVTNMSISPIITSKLNEADILEQINKLPDHYRVIFNLYEVEGYSHKEISDMLQIQESTSRTKLTRAKQMIKNIFNDLDFNGNDHNTKSSLFKV